MCSLPKCHFFSFLPELLFPPPPFDFFLGFALGLASLNQNNSHNAWGERFLWVNDICMQRRQSCQFLSFADACQPVRSGVSGVTRGDCGDVGNSFFSRRPSAQTLGSLGTREQHPFSEEVKGDAGCSSWYFHLRSQRGPAAGLCSSPALPFPVQLRFLLP